MGNRFSRIASNVVDDVIHHGYFVANTISNFEKHYPNVIKKIVDQTLTNLEELQTQENWMSKINN